MTPGGGDWRDDMNVFCPLCRAQIRDVSYTGEPICFKSPCLQIQFVGQRLERNRGR